jgi:quinohemoprotein amine dehydrogenase beta subunit
MRVKINWVAAAALGLVVAMEAAARPKQDYIVTGAKPDHLFVIDPAKQSIVGDFHIPEAHDWVSTIVPSPDSKVAYVLTNNMESISGIELSTGQQVFRANLSSGDERVTCFYSFDVTPDGKELIVFENPAKLGLDEYTAEDTRFAVFKTDAGVDAKPIRTFPAPRRVSTLLARKDGKSFYALGFDLYEFDRLTGKQLGVRGVRNWEYPNRSIPDVMSVRPVSEPSGTFMNPVYSTVPAADGKGEPVPKTTIMGLNLVSGDLQYHDLTEALSFFAVVKSPTRPEVYGVYTDLTKIDSNSYTPTKRVDLDHTYYAVLVSTDGKEVYAAGAANDVTIFDSETFAKKGNIRLPGDQAASSPRVVRR